MTTASLLTFLDTADLWDVSPSIIAIIISSLVAYRASLHKVPDSQRYKGTSAYELRESPRHPAGTSAQQPSDHENSPYRTGATAKSSSSTRTDDIEELLTQPDAIFVRHAYTVDTAKHT